MKYDIQNKKVLWNHLNSWNAMFLVPWDILLCLASFVDNYFYIKS